MKSNQVGIECKIKLNLAAYGNILPN